jgi:hypothetical protein
MIEWILIKQGRLRMIGYDQATKVLSANTLDHHRFDFPNITPEQYKAILNSDDKWAEIKKLRQNGKNRTSDRP